MGRSSDDPAGPLMPLLFSLGQHSALDAMISRLQEGESALFAFLDDLYVMCDPGRVAEVYSILEEELWRHARIQIHQGKTKIWNKGGFVPAGWEDFEAGACMLDPNAIVWRGNGDIPTTKQGLHPDFVQDQLSKLSDRHDVLLRRIAMVEAGSCWSIVQLLARISSCGLSVLGKPPLSLSTMMTSFGHVCARCSALILQASLTLPGLAPPSRYVLVVWASAAP